MADFAAVLQNSNATASTRERAGAGLKQAQRALKPERPPRLAVTAVFRDAGGDNVLDAEEKGVLSVRVRNAGAGNAVDLSRHMRHDPGGDWVSYTRETGLGLIPVGEERAWDIPLTATRAVPEGQARFRIEVKEGNGYDADPVEIRIPTRAFRPPDLKVVGVTIDDGEKGLAFGNNNGLLELGESAELTVQLRNVGTGPTRDTRVTPLTANPDVTVLNPESRSLGDLSAGASAGIKVALAVTKRYKGPARLPCAVDISDARADLGKRLEIPVDIGRTPAGIQVVEVAAKVGAVPVVAAAEAGIPSVDVPPSFGAAAGGGTGHAVVIGIEKYRDLPPATYAARDATIMREYVAAGCGVPAANLALLINERAGKSDLTRYLEDWLGQRVGAGDRVVVYFSGHGAPDPVSGDAYLMPYDGAPGALKTTGYSLKRLYEKLRALPARQVTVFLDACFSGVGSRGTTGQMLLAKGIRPLVVEAETPVGMDGKVVALSASRGSEISGSYEAARHGLFTYFLLRGLGGAADADRDKRVSVEELIRYVRPEVEGVARREDGREQQPQVQPPLPALGTLAARPLVVLK